MVISTCSSQFLILPMMCLELLPEIIHPHTSRSFWVTCMWNHVCGCCVFFSHWANHIIVVPIFYTIQATLLFIPSGKRLHSYGKSPFSMGKSTISMAIFNSKLLVYQRVHVHPLQSTAKAGDAFGPMLVSEWPLSLLVLNVPAVCWGTVRVGSPAPTRPGLVLDLCTIL